MTAKGLLPPYGFDWRGLGQGTRVEEVAAGGANCSVLPCPSNLVQALPGLLAGWGWAPVQLIASMQHNSKVSPKLLHLCRALVPQGSLGLAVLCWSLCQTQYPLFKNNIWV